MSIVSQVNLSLALTEEEYRRRLVRYQTALNEIGHQVYVQKRPVVIVFEGWDAAGKGGAIRRLTERLDARGYVVHAIGAPEGEDKTHHYLYRFWRRLPESGQIVVFDRSWYGRVLVERVERLCSEAEWKRAYREINQFERQLSDFGAIVCKFWLHISKDEQLRRFEVRAGAPYKAWMNTDEGWRSREKWDLYEVAVEEMLLKTSTLTAPWTIVEGNDKLWARVKVLQTVVDRLGQELNFTPDILAGELEKAPKEETVEEAAPSAKKELEADKPAQKGKEDKEDKKGGKEARKPEKGK